MLEFINVKKTYDTGENTVSVLTGISFKMNKGESIAIMGPSGSGKSTLLNIAGALDKQTEGEVLFEGRNTGDLSENEAAMFRNTRIGFVFQEHHLLPQCTVLENVLIPTIPLASKARKKDAVERARLLLARTGLSEKTDRFPGQLSVGERQRVAVVRALINSPLLVLADEPTGSLDNKTADIVSDLLLELNAEFATALIVVTHSPHLAQKLNKAYELGNGILTQIK
jgi:lipoprotein-releasing system ATP-binding protein